MNLDKLLEQRKLIDERIKHAKEAEKKRQREHAIRALEKAGILGLPPLEVEREILNIAARIRNQQTEQTGSEE